MRTWQSAGRTVVISLITLAGCTSIHSAAVQELIAIEGRKIDAATAAARQFKEETAKRIEAMKSARADLDAGLKRQRASEHVHTLIFSSNQNVASKAGIDAYAIAYLIGQIYLADGVGLEKRVMDQFDRDFDALAELGTRIDASWASLKKIHAGIAEYSAKSALASVDPALVSAVIEQIPSASEKAETALKAARGLNEVLDRVVMVPALRMGTLDQTRSLTIDLIDLLERVKK